MGRSFINSNSVLVSTANCLAINDILPDSEIYRLSFVNLDACHIEILKNGSTVSTAYLEAYDCFEVENGDSTIQNIKIVEPNIRYKYQGAYERK
jgi:hypothetical protein